MEAVALFIIFLVLCLAVIGFFLPFTEDAPKWADTDYDPEYAKDSLAFPGTSDTRTVREVDEYVKSENAKLIQQSNLGELP